MSTTNRINVDSGRPLEALAHYSRALRCGAWVLQSGTTAIDKRGNVIGVGDVATQVDAIVDIAAESMALAGGRLDDVVRARVYLTDMALTDAAASALARHFRDVRPASTLVQVSGLARPTQLVEIEFDAIDGAKDKAVRFSSGRPTEERYAYSRAVRVDDHVFISGTTAMTPTGEVAHPGDTGAQTRATFDAIFEALDEAGGDPSDLLYTKTFLIDGAQASAQTEARLAALGTVRPSGTLLAIPGLVSPQMRVEIEAEAIIGGAKERQDIYLDEARERGLGFARAVVARDVVYVSGCTAIQPDLSVGGKGDWAAQYDLCHDAIATALEKADVAFDDVVRRRIFTVKGTTQNRPYGEGPAWFSGSRPTSLGCAISGLAHPDMLVEVDAFAIRGAAKDIVWTSAS